MTCSAFGQVIKEVVAGLEAPSFDAEGEAVAAMAEHVLANAAPCIAVLRTCLG